MGWKKGGRGNFSASWSPASAPFRFCRPLNREEVILATLRRCRGCNYLIELHLHVALRQTGRLTWQTSLKDQKQRTVKRRGHRAHTCTHACAHTQRETQTHVRQLNSSGCTWRILECAQKSHQKGCNFFLYIHIYIFLLVFAV